MKEESLYVVGAGGHGKVVADICLCAGLEVAGFVDNDSAKQGSEVLGLPIVGDNAWLEARAKEGVVAVALGIGDNATRQRVVELLYSWGVELITPIHPSAVVASSARIGAGTVVMAGVAVNPDAEIGEGVILNTGVVIEHDNRIGDYAHLSANAATGGTVSVGARTHVGLGGVVLPNLSVGSDCVVGAGAVVIRDVPDGKVMAGVPAREIAPRSR